MEVLLERTNNLTSKVSAVSDHLIGSQWPPKKPQVIIFAADVDHGTDMDFNWVALPVWGLSLRKIRVQLRCW